jgi:hypothetical protein
MEHDELEEDMKKMENSNHEEDCIGWHWAEDEFWK